MTDYLGTHRDEIDDDWPHYHPDDEVRILEMQARHASNERGYRRTRFRVVLLVVSVILFLVWAV